jgi:hypothetical protein
LVKLQLFERFGEEIDQFKIIISHGQYKKNHPFASEETPGEGDVSSVPLDEAERAEVEAQLAAVADPKLRRAVQEAMVADLEWKKGIARNA